MDEIFNVERYRMRGTATGYPGDLVERHSRVIYGRLFDFSRVRWADGSVTVRAYVGGKATVLHEWEG